MSEIIAGGLSGAFTKTCIAPLERVKILHQLYKNKYPNSVYGTLKTVVKNEGTLALYKGNGVNVLRVIPVYALKFSFNDKIKNSIKTSGQPLNFSQLVLSGCIAGFLQTSITYPLETMRTRFTLGIKYNGFFNAIQTIVQKEKLRGLYKGYSMSFLTGSPYVGFQFSFYEMFNRKLDNKLVSGAAAGILAQTLLYPGDTIRRHMQINGINGEKKIYNNPWHCYKTITNKNGHKVLFNGLKTNYIKCIPGAAIQFWAYENFLKILS